MKKAVFMVIILLFCLNVFGCAGLKEMCAGFRGVSTKALEEARKEAVARHFNYDVTIVPVTKSCTFLPKISISRYPSACCIFIKFYRTICGAKITAHNCYVLAGRSKIRIKIVYFWGFGS